MENFGHIGLYVYGLQNAIINTWRAIKSNLYLGGYTDYKEP